MDAPVDKLIRTLLVQEHEIPRLGMRLLLQEHGGIEVAGDAENASDAMELLVGLRPEVVLIGETLPDSDAAALCRAIRSMRPETRVLMYPSGTDPGAMLHALSAGVSGVVPHSAAVTTLIEAVKAAAAGQTLDDIAPSADAGRVAAALPAQARSERDLSSLSPQEHRVLREVAAGLTNKQVAIALGLSEKTVKNYLHNAFKKMKVTRRSQAVARYIHHVVAKAGADSADPSAGAAA